MPDPKDNPNEWNPPIHQQSFDVVLLADGKSEFTATPEDYKRVTVRAESTLAASGAPEVSQESTGYHVCAVTPMGVLTPQEMLSRQRAAAKAVA